MPRLLRSRRRQAINAPGASSRSRLRWQCRRGMRELDVLLIDYLDQRYIEAGEREMLAFERLLSLSDPELVAYLLFGETPEDSELELIVNHVRR